MTEMKLLGAITAVAVVAALSACSSAQRSPTMGSNPSSSPPAGSSPVAPRLPPPLRFTKIADLGADSPGMGGPAVLTSAGLWVAPAGRNQLIQFTASGGASPIALPPQPVGNVPQGVAAASDGSIWISEMDSVLRVGSDHRVTTFAVQGNPNGRIAEGSDKAMWVTEVGKDRVARIMNGQVHEFPLAPAPVQVQVQCGGRCPYGITSGPDGNLWITESQLAAGDLVGRMTPQGQYKDWPLDGPGAALNDITAGPDRALWFGESRARRLGRVTTAGAVTEQAVDLPVHASGTRGVVAGTALIWYTPSLAPAYSGDPVEVGAAIPGGASRVYQITGAKGPVAALVPVPSLHAEVVDVVTGSGQIWQGSSSTGPAGSVGPR